jgi:hypothetical protein
MTVATRQDDVWQVVAAEPVGAVDNLLSRLLARAGGGAVALGVDLPDAARRTS